MEFNKKSNEKFESGALSVRYDDNYYQTLMKDFGYEPFKFERINFSLGSLSKEELQMRWLCHHEGDSFSKKFESGEKSIVATGFGMSGVPHIGTISQIMRAITLQRNGIPVSMVIGDLDAYNNKLTPIKVGIKLADQFKEFALNLGFSDKQPSILRSQYDELDVLRTSYIIGRFMDDKMFDNAEIELYGSTERMGEFSSIHMPYNRKLSLNLMTADFIDLYKRGKCRNLMVMLGVDEHMYVRLARKVVERMVSSQEFDDFSMNVSGIYTPLIIGLNNHPKMSKSVPGSGITADMEPNVIRNLIMNGEGNYDRPENNVVYQMISSASYMGFDEIKEAYDACSVGGYKWHQIKSEYADMLIDVCGKWGVPK